MLHKNKSSNNSNNNCNKRRRQHKKRKPKKIKKHKCIRRCVCACVWVCEKDSRSTLFINFVKYAHIIQQQKERISNKHQTRLRSAGERERERERRSSGSAYVQVAVAVHFPFRSPFSACPALATWNWNFPALECSCSVLLLLLLLLLGRLCCTRTSTDNSGQSSTTHTHTLAEGGQRRADETKGMKKKHTGKRAWNGGMGVDFIFFLFGCCFFFSLACLRYVVCSIIFFLFTLCFRLSTRFWFCVFLCATYAFLSLFRSLLSVRVRRALAATEAATRQQKAAEPEAA